MKLYFEAIFYTDGDFSFDKNRVQEKIRDGNALYEGADINYVYTQDDEHIIICVNAEGDADSCRYYVRDLLEALICSISTHKYWLVKDLYELLVYFHTKLWEEPNQFKIKGLSGNYSGTWLKLSMEEHSKI